MCGIAGFFGNDSRHVATPAAMLAALKKRGPDAQQAVFWNSEFRRSDDTIHHALLHARLAIIDPRPEADQPMSNDDGSLWLCYNGEVYGWGDDAAALKSQGVEFRTRSDTEFILRGYQAWGIDGLLPRLRGMFAFALLDLRARKLYLVRDRMGLKPLVYAHTQDGLAFGSLVRAVLPWLPEDQRAFHPDAIDAYLAHRYIPAPMTVFSAIRRLENGHLLEYDLTRNTLEKRRYWTPQPSTDEWRATLDAAIELRTVADRPLGIFLSGGVDSSLVACRLAAHGHNDLRTFSAAFPGSNMDESADAAAFAAACGLPNTAIPIPTRIAEDFARIVADLDEPFADPSSFPAWYLARAASQEVKVVLGGDGGDELFAGYKRLPKHLNTAWRAGLRLALPSLPNASGKGWRKYLTEFSLDWHSAYALRFSGCTPSQRAFLQPGHPPRRAVWWRLPDDQESTPLKQLLAWDYANYLPEYILRKGDLTTLCHGLELRAPLLDHRFFEAVLALPDEQRFTRPAKQLLKEACPELKPIFRRRKRGFNPPLATWLHDDLAERLAGLGSRLEALSAGQIDAEAADALVARYRVEEGLAEQVLQLLVLDESLAQLRALARESIV
ncbi:MAG: asparagine synthase (glutamine-hydrolyzing) [Sulfuricella sp.]|nr:asparagine synthase (glutamine-hydrolyzing) [Sulfuricella sp.]